MANDIEEIIVINNMEMKQRPVKVYLSQPYVPICGNNHSQDNIIDKEKQHRLKSYISRKKENDRIIIRSRKELEQTEQQLEIGQENNSKSKLFQSFRKNNASRVILSKKLINDIANVNQDISILQRDMISEFQSEAMKKHDHLILKQRQVIARDFIKNVQENIRLVNTMKVSTDTKSLLQKKEKIQNLDDKFQNRRWEDDQRLQDLLAERERIKIQIQKEVQVLISNDEQTKLVNSNNPVTKIFRLIFGKEYALRQRTDKTITNQEIHFLQKRVLSPKKREPSTFKRCRFAQQQQILKEKDNEKIHFPLQFDPFSSSIENKTSDLNLKTLSTQQAKQLKYLEQYFHLDTLKHLQDFFFNPISEALEVDSKQKTWEDMFNYLKQKGVLLNEQQNIVKTDQHILLDQETSTPSQTAKNENNIKIQGKNMSMKQNQASNDQVYSKQFYQYIKEYNIIAKSQKYLSPDQKLKTIQVKLQNNSSVFDFYEKFLEQTDDNRVHKSEKFLPIPPDLPFPSPIPSVLPFPSELPLPQVLPIPSDLPIPYPQVLPFPSVLPIPSNSYFIKSNLGNHDQVKNIMKDKSSEYGVSTQDSKQNLSLQLLASRKSLLELQTISSPLNSILNKSTQEKSESSSRSNFKSSSCKNAQNIKIKLPILQESKTLVEVTKIKKKDQNTISRSLSLKRSCIQAVNKHMEYLASSALKEETSQYIDSVSKLYRKCRVESLNTKKIQNESIRKNLIFSKNYKQIDQALSKISFQ